MYRCSPKINTHAHTCMHTYTQAHWRPPLFTPRCICMQTAHFETIWSHSGGFARSVPSLGENIAGAEWKLHFAGANISPGLWKIPFKWSQAEKRQRICLAFCLTVFSAYTAVFSDGTAHRRVLGNTDVKGGGGWGGLVWWNLRLFDCQSVCISVRVCAGTLNTLCCCIPGYSTDTENS